MGITLQLSCQVGEQQVRRHEAADGGCTLLGTIHKEKERERERDGERGRARGSSHPGLVPFPGYYLINALICF